MGSVSEPISKDILRVGVFPQVCSRVTPGIPAPALPPFCGLCDMGGFSQKSKNQFIFAPVYSIDRRSELCGCVRLALTMTALALAGGKPQVTFHRDVLPILQRTARAVTVPGEPAPMAFFKLHRDSALGKSDSGSGPSEADAAVVCRSARRQVRQ